MNRYKLTVHMTKPGTFSHQLQCYCKTVGKPANIEKAYKIIKVNFYKFREWVTNTLKVVDFDNWYLTNKYTVSFNDTLSQYINATEQRTAIYSPKTIIDRLLNEAIQLATANNNTIKSILQTA